MVVWRFGDYPEDGEAWLKDPSHLFVYVDYESRQDTGTPEWRRLMVVTKSWLEGHLSGLEPGAALWVGLPALLVLRDARGAELRDLVNDAVQRGILEMYSSPTVNVSPPPMEDAR